MDQLASRRGRIHGCAMDCRGIAQGSCSCSDPAALANNFGRHNHRYPVRLKPFGFNGLRRGEKRMGDPTGPVPSRPNTLSSARGPRAVAAPTRGTTRVAKARIG